MAAIGDAKIFAGLMGYRWQEDRHWDLLYDFLVFRRESVRVVRVRLTWYPIDPDALNEELLPSRDPRCA